MLKEVPLALPAILGQDFSGIVRKIGAKVRGYKAGDPVFGRQTIDRLISGRSGTYAEWWVVDANDVVLKPECLSHEQAAACPTVSSFLYTHSLCLVRSLSLLCGGPLVFHKRAFRCVCVCVCVCVSIVEKDARCCLCLRSDAYPYRLIIPHHHLVFRMVRAQDPQHSWSHDNTRSVQMCVCVVVAPSHRRAFSFTGYYACTCTSLNICMDMRVFMYAAKHDARIHRNRQQTTDSDKKSVFLPGHDLQSHYKVSMCMYDTPSLATRYPCMHAYLSRTVHLDHICAPTTPVNVKSYL